MSWGIAEQERRLANLIRPGTIAEVAPATARVKVRSGGNLSDWLPWLTPRAGKDRTWWAPEVGEQVLVLSPSGNLGQGYVLPGLYRDSNPPPASDPDIHKTLYDDGSTVEHNRATGTYTIEATGEVVIKGATKITLEATNIELKGNIAMSGGALTHEGRNIGFDHPHTDVEPGGGLSGPPAPSAP